VCGAVLFVQAGVVEESSDGEPIGEGPQTAERSGAV
jgi:hypothetical protein